MDTMSKSLLLTFNTTRDTERTLRLSDPDPNLEASSVIAAGQHIVASDLFDPELTMSGSLSNLVRAAIEQVHTRVLIQA